MPTLRQIEASRRNSQKPIGPITPDPEFDQLCEDIEAEFRPKSGAERLYLESNGRLAGETPPHGSGRGILLERLRLVRCRLERSQAKSLRELERLQDARRNQPEPAGEPEPNCVVKPDPRTAGRPRPRST